MKTRTMWNGLSAVGREKLYRIMRNFLSYSGLPRVATIAFVFGLVAAHAQSADRLRFVKPGGSGNQSGQSWANAYDNVEDALTDAENNPTLTYEVWVAQGTYVPTLPESNNPNNPIQKRVYILRDNVVLYGGFLGNETLVTQRDPFANPTILSGLHPGGLRSYNVVDGSGTTAAAVLDGFVVRDGDAALSSGQSSRGGGIYIEDGSPTISNCIIEHNICETAGGGVHIRKGVAPTVTPVFQNCIIRFNEATTSGGGVFVRSSDPVFVDCRFEGNESNSVVIDEGGGAVYLFEGSALFDGCEFVANTSRKSGGAIFNQKCQLTVLRTSFVSNTTTTTGEGGAAVHNTGASTVLFSSCEFRANASAGRGGAVANYTNTDARFSNCVFNLNVAGTRGGAMFNRIASPVLAHCTVVYNRSNEIGGGVYGIDDADVVLFNSIVWRNANLGGAEVSPASNLSSNGNSQPTAVYSLIEGLEPGDLPDGQQGSFDADPAFVDAAGLDGVQGTEDDDLRLFPGSPCIDRGSALTVLGIDYPADWADLDGDADTTEPLPVDLAGLARCIDDPVAQNLGLGAGCVPDLGAFEHHPGDVASTWAASNSGAFTGAPNWSPAAPAPGDRAAFVTPSSPAGYSVSFSAPASTADVSVTRGVVQLSLSGNAFALAGPPSARLRVGPYEDEQATLKITGGAFSADIVQIGAADGTDALLHVFGTTASLNATGAFTIKHGTLRLDPGSIVNSVKPVRALPGGVLASAGQINGDVEVTGLFEPGLDSISTSNVNGALTFRDPLSPLAAGALAVDLGCAESSDLLTATGPITLGGGLLTRLADGCVPEEGDTYTVLSAPTIADGFDLIYLPQLPSPLALLPRFAPQSTSGGDAFVLTVAPLGSGLGFAASAAGATLSDLPRDVCAGDFNDDGVDDLAFVFAGAAGNPPLPGSVVVFFGPDLTVSTSPLPVGRDPTAIAAADFNIDNKLDLLVVNRFDANATLYLGNGIGGFALSQVSPVTIDLASPLALAVGDVNSDGRPDIAVSGETLPVPPDDAGGLAGVQVILNQFGLNAGIEAAFAPGNTFSAPGSVADDLGIDDIDSDRGLDDLMVVNRSANQVDVHYDAGGVPFTLPLPMNAPPMFVNAADVNGDGIADLLVTSPEGGIVSVLPGAGGRTFGAPIDLPAGSQARSPLVRDFDGDGDPDVGYIAQPQDSTSNTVMLIRNDLSPGQPLMLTSGIEVDTGLEPALLVIADIGDGSGDALADLVAIGGPAGGLGAVAGAGSGIATQVRTSANISTPPCPGDANYDGFVNFADLNLLLFNWSTQVFPGTGGDVASVDSGPPDGFVDFVDLNELLSSFGVTCP